MKKLLLLLVKSLLHQKAKLSKTIKYFLLYKKKKKRDLFQSLCLAFIQWSIKHGVRSLTGNVLLHYLLQSAVTGDTLNQLPCNYAKVFPKWQIPIGWARALPFQTRLIILSAHPFIHFSKPWPVESCRWVFTAYFFMLLKFLLFWNLNLSEGREISAGLRRKIVRNHEV